MAANDGEEFDLIAELTANRAGAHERLRTAARLRGYHLSRVEDPRSFYREGIRESASGVYLGLNRTFLLDYCGHYAEVVGGERAVGQHSSEQRKSQKFPGTPVLVTVSVPIAELRHYMRNGDWWELLTSLQEQNEIDDSIESIDLAVTLSSAVRPEWVAEVMELKERLPRLGQTAAWDFQRVVSRNG